MSRQGKQVKILSGAQVRAALNHVDSVSRYPERDRVMILLSVKAGLRANEIASLTWSMVTDAQSELGDAIHLPNSASKGKNGGRTVPLNPALHQALGDLRVKRGDDATPHARIIHSERGDSYSSAAVQVWFARLYSALGFDGASSRRTFITNAAKTRPVVACGIFKSSLVTVASPRRCDTLRATAGPSRMWSG